MGSFGLPQDTLCMFTPGGGGYGNPPDKDEAIDYDILPSKRRRYNQEASHHYTEKGSVYAYRMAQEQG